MFVKKISVVKISLTMVLCLVAVVTLPRLTAITSNTLDAYVKTTEARRISAETNKRIALAEREAALQREKTIAAKAEAQRRVAETAVRNRAEAAKTHSEAYIGALNAITGKTDHLTNDPSCVTSDQLFSALITANAEDTLSEQQFRTVLSKLCE